MTRTVVTKTSFASGELDPLLYGRLDLRAQEDGAARLRNVVVHPTGGVSRRPGLAHVCTLGGVVRLASFDAPGGPFLLAFADRLVHVLLDGHVLQTLDTDWSAEQARVLSWVRWNDRLFICHADVRPRQLRRTLLGAWTLDPWEFERPVGGAGYSRSSEPFAKFVDPSVAMEIDNGTSSAIPADPGRIITLTTSLPTFTADHVDSIFASRAATFELQVSMPLPGQGHSALPLSRSRTARPRATGRSRPSAPPEGGRQRWPSSRIGSSSAVRAIFPTASGYPKPGGRAISILAMGSTTRLFPFD